MKKLSVVFAGIMTALTVILLLACSNDGMKNVSERRSEYFTATGDGLTVTAVSGVRETPFEADGVVGELKPYTLLTVVPDSFDVDAVFTYSAVIGEYKYGGTLIAHPFAASYSAELDVEAAGEFTVSISFGGKTIEYTLQSVLTADTLTFDMAIDAAKTELRPRGDYEIRARIIKNPLNSDGVCWHVAFISADGSGSVLLDPVTAKVLAKKE